MFKKIITIKVLFISILILSITTIKARSSFNVVINIKGKDNIVELNCEKKISFEYDSEDKKLIIMEDEKQIKSFIINKADSIRFDTQYFGDISINGGYNYHTIRNANFNEVSLIFVETEEYVFMVNNIEEYNDRYTLDMTFTFKSVAAISGEDLIITNVDEPFEVEDIIKIANIKAYDDYDGDITDKIKYDASNYINNKKKLGTYDIVFEVENSSKIKTTYILKVRVIDLTKPTIPGPDQLEYSYKKNKTIEDVLNLYTVKDNCDNNIKLEILENNINFKKPGQYNLILKAKDNSNNETTKNVKVNILDDVKPVIIDENKGFIEINYKEKITNGLLLLGLMAEDEIDGDLTNNIKVIKNNIKSKIGEYEVLYEVEDKAGNKTSYTRVYKVISTDKPQFYVSKDLLTIEDINAMNNDQLAEILANIYNINMESYEIINNDYENNESNPGVYNLSVKVNDIYGNEHIINKNIRVFNQKELNNETNNFNYKYLLIGLIPMSTLSVYFYRKRK